MQPKKKGEAALEVPPKKKEGRTSRRTSEESKASSVARKQPHTKQDAHETPEVQVSRQVKAQRTTASKKKRELPDSDEDSPAHSAAEDAHEEHATVYKASRKSEIYRGATGKNMVEDVSHGSEMAKMLEKVRAPQKGPYKQDSPQAYEGMNLWLIIQND